MKWHGPDFFQHFSLHLIDPTHPLFDKDKEEEGWKLYARFYRICDNLVSSILEAVDEENTVVCVVSDHGHVANVVTHVWNDILEKAGLFSRKPDGSIDWSKTKAFIGGEGVWINLKGRYPHGIVEPGEEYEEVREQVIKLLSELKDPLSGAPIFSLVCRKEDAGILGMGGGVIVKYILSDEKNFPFPLNFSLLFFLAFILIFISLSLFILAIFFLRFGSFPTYILSPILNVTPFFGTNSRRVNWFSPTP